MPHSHLQDNYAHSKKFKSTTELAALNCGPNVTWTPALHDMRLGSLRNCKIHPSPTHCVLKWCPAHIDPFKSFSADVWQHQNSSESSAQKAQQLLRKDSLEFWKRECTIICNSLSLCYLQFSWFVSENTKLNLRITALVSQWAAQRQVLVDMHTWAAVTLLFQLSLPSRHITSCYGHLSWILFQLVFPVSFSSALLCYLWSLSTLLSLRLSPLLTLPFSFSVDHILPPRLFLYLMPPNPVSSIFPFLNPSPQRPPTVLSLNLSPSRGWGHWYLSSSHSNSWTFWTPMTCVFTGTSRYQHKHSANPDGDVTRLECIQHVNCF